MAPLAESPVPGIAVVTNPRSRQNRRNPKMAGQLAYLLGQKGEVAQPQSREELEVAARRFRDQGVDLLAINGGDGTAHVVLSAFKQVWGDDPLPMIALLRGGTMNTVASGIGVKGSPTQLLGTLVDRYYSKEPLPYVERNLLSVPGEKTQYGFLFGNGLISNFLELYYEGSEPSPQKAAALLAQGCFSTAVGGELGKRLMRPLEVEIEVNGETWAPRPYLTVAAGTVDDIGLRFRPFPDAPRTPGHLQLLALGCSPWQFVQHLPRVRMALPMEAPNSSSVVTQGFRLRSSTPIGYMIDGDFHVGGTELEVRIGPRLKMVVLE